MYTVAIEAHAPRGVMILFGPLCLIFNALMALSSLPSIAKRRRLENLEAFRRGLPHISQSALAAVCHEIREHGIPDAFSRQDQLAARNIIRGIDTEYGPIIKSASLNRNDNGRPISVEYANIWAMLHHISRKGGELAELIRLRHEELPSSARQPWTSCFVYNGAPTIISTYA